MTSIIKTLELDKPPWTVHCTGTALALHGHCTGTARALHGHCTFTALARSKMVKFLKKSESLGNKISRINSIRINKSINVL